MQLGLGKALPALVEAQYTSAKATQALTFSSTQLAILHTRSGLPLQVRYCPALAKKPTAQKDAQSKAPKPDPFDNPSSDLLIAEFPSDHPSHLLVLNKYPVIPQHFIIATKLKKQQTHLLEPEDLAFTHACIREWDEGRQNGKLFAFFNSGQHSGASQPHRHLQFLSVDEMKRDQQDQGAWDPLISRMLDHPVDNTQDLKHNPGLPFIHYAVKLTPQATLEDLQSAYEKLYAAAAAAVRAYIASTEKPDLELHPSEDGSSSISYNLAMTSTVMAILPRRKEAAVIKKKDGTEAGSVALNGTVLGGTLMVKLDDEWNALRDNDMQLDDILEAIGIPK